MTKGWFLVAKTRMNFWNNRLKRFCAGLGSNSWTAGCLPISSSNSGITSIITWALSPKADPILACQCWTRSALSVSNCRIKLCKACTHAENGISRLNWSNFPLIKYPRCWTIGLWTSLTTAVLPMPENPATSMISVVAVGGSLWVSRRLVGDTSKSATAEFSWGQATRWKAPNRVKTSVSLP